LNLGEGSNIVSLGIVSFGSDEGCAKGYPVAFTSVAHYVDWISDKTGILIKD